MGSLDHWQPVARTRTLRRRPRRVEIDGHGLVLFRARNGAIGALDDRCPHRHMRLSCGQVVADRIQCPYHGWQFGTDGRGESQGTPAQAVRTTAYDVKISHGLVWVKAAEAEADFPQFGAPGYFPVGVLERRLPIPLELVLDNTCEMEHAPFVHRVLGYDADQLAKVRIDVTADEESVRVCNVGPARTCDPLMRFFLGISPDYDFVDEWVTKFSPVHTVFQHWWRHRDSGREGRIKTLVHLFYVPVNETETRLWMISYVKSNWPGPRGGLRLFSWFIRHHLRAELDRDIRMLANLDDHTVDVAGMKLSRFDRVLIMNRERVQRVYRGLSEPARIPTETEHA